MSPACLCLGTPGLLVPVNPSPPSAALIVSRGGLWECFLQVRPPLTELLWAMCDCGWDTREALRAGAGL